MRVAYWKLLLSVLEYMFRFSSTSLGRAPATFWVLHDMASIFEASVLMQSVCFLRLSIGSVKMVFKLLRWVYQLAFVLS